MPHIEADLQIIDAGINLRFRMGGITRPPTAFGRFGDFRAGRPFGLGAAAFFHLILFRSLV